MNSESGIKTSLRSMYAYRHEPERMRIFADFYWRALLSIASAMTVIVIAFGIYELSAVLQDRGASGAVTDGKAKSVPTLNKAQLQSTLEKFQARVQLFESVRASTPQIADPSQ